MTNTMGGAHLCMPQSIFQQMMDQQNPQQRQVGSWMHMPQVPPITIPWSVPALQQQELIRFTGETSSGPILHQKRKLEAPDVVDMHQSKQFITEEKMTAHFKSLRISSIHETESPVPSTSSSCSHRQLDMDLDVDGRNAINGEQLTDVHPRLVLSEELKRIQEEPILPSTLLSKLERPSMAVVLWEPPNRHLRILPTRDTPTPIPSTSGDNNNNNNNNNNNDATPDLNNITSSALSTFEPMEL
ncbi:rho GTPase-activating protein gacM-like isoform X1 [Formica exsecta]|uniref:rho GTPase-activating protein gacM-like isoform X1 n=1 Tax=Formica exsecta TaxID=72781 RepID=UPI001143F6D5|nr:rho GTPase-activating protein gacM-like isoform X1 [Formica exsecta]XP_029659558.1 rho GTPase-activating protein gacM-like isoform X1 [Formica exsecta]